MATYTFTSLARVDIARIARFTQRKWGVSQARTYQQSIEEACQLLADRPGLGRVTTETRFARKRFEHESHVIFYREESEGIIVQRILHKSMLAKRHRI